MNKPICLVASLLMLAASAPADAQDFGAVIAQSPPAALFRVLRDKLTGNPPQPVIMQQESDVASHEDTVYPSASIDNGPARPEEVLSARSKAIMAERDSYGALKTPTICTDCAR
jgi:hypothetical protein